MHHYLGFFFVLTISACVSSGEDYELTRKVGKYLDTAEVVPLNSRLADTTHSGKITLHFMEKQIIHTTAEGLSSRGRENEIETIIVKR